MEKTIQFNPLFINEDPCEAIFEKKNNNYLNVDRYYKKESSFHKLTFEIDWKS